jgi:integrase
LNPEAELETVSGDGTQQLQFKDPRIAQYAWKCKLRGLEENTIERRCYLLQRLVNDGADLNQPTTVETLLAVKNYPTPTKWLMVNTYRVYCKAYHIDWEPVHVKYKPKMPYIPTQEECVNFLAALPPKLMVFCRLLFETGCRSGEAVQIEWQDISMENSTVKIAHPEKGSNERMVKVSRELCQLIDNLPRKYGLYVFNPKIRTWLAMFQTQRRKIAAKFNKPEWLKLHFHSFRHIRGTYDIINGIPLYEVKDKLGHACISNTDKYVHWAKQLCPGRDNRYYTLTTATDEEADRALEAGWQFIFVNPNTQRAHWKKAK